MSILFKIFTFFAGSLCFCMLISFFTSLIISRSIKKRAGLKEKVRISSLEDVDNLSRKRGKAISAQQRARIWGDAMNILMTVDSLKTAETYTERVVRDLGNDSAEFKKYADAIINARFRSSSRNLESVTDSQFLQS